MAALLWIKAGELQCVCVSVSSTLGRAGGLRSSEVCHSYLQAQLIADLFSKEGQAGAGRGGAGYKEEPLWEEQLSVRRNLLVNFLWGRDRNEGLVQTYLDTKQIVLLV